MLSHAESPALLLLCVHSHCGCLQAGIKSGAKLMLIGTPAPQVAAAQQVGGDERYRCKDGAGDAACMWLQYMQLMAATCEGTTGGAAVYIQGE
jgi:hypothetical protein